MRSNSWIEIFFVIILGLCAILMSTKNAHGFSLDESGNTQVSGYAFTTIFSDPSWYQNLSVAAVNVDYTNRLFAVRTQISTYQGDPIRRLTVEKDFSVSQKTESIVKVGRFPRLSSFYNSVTDTPADYGMALLPQSGYSYRMYNGSFILMDGVQTVTNIHTSSDLISIVSSYGYAVIPSQNDLNQEIYHTPQPVPNIQIDPNETYDLAIHHLHGPFHCYVALSDYKADVDPTVVTPQSYYLTQHYHSADYLTTRYGIQYTGDTWWAQTEFTQGVTSVLSAQGNQTMYSMSQDQNVVIGYRFNDENKAYVDGSQGRNLTAQTKSTDHVVGYTHTKHQWTESIEYHQGATEGGWRAYNSTITHWNLFVTSITYQFR